MWSAVAPFFSSEPDAACVSEMGESCGLSRIFHILNSRVKREGYGVRLGLAPSINVFLGD